MHKTQNSGTPLPIFTEWQKLDYQPVSSMCGKQFSNEFVNKKKFEIVNFVNFKLRNTFFEVNVTKMIKRFQMSFATFSLQSLNLLKASNVFQCLLKASKALKVLKW
jgi:hypothetical protein